MKQQSAVLRRFGQLIQHCTPADLLILHKWGQVCHRVQDYEPQSRSMVPCTAPWPVQWLLLARHRKHRFRSGRLPNVQDYFHAVRQFVNKMNWKWWFRHEVRTSPPFLPKRSGQTPTCSKVVDPALGYWSRQLQSQLLDECRAQRHKLRWSNTRLGNMSGLENYALRLIRSMNIIAFPNDKSTWFSTVPSAEVPVMFDMIISQPYYQIATFTPAVISAAQRGYFKLAEEIAIFEDDEDIKKQVCKSLHKPNATMVAQLDATVKTQKAPGKVVPRPLHCSTNYAFEGVARWIMYHLTGILRTKAPHLLRDSFDLAQRLQTFKHPLQVFWLHLDAKDFYLSGKSLDIINDICSIIDNSQLKGLMRKALEFILHYQYIENPHASDECFRYVQCILGSGQGLTHSGAVSDSALYARETRVLDPGTLQEYGVVAYYRYRDDFLIGFETDNDIWPCRNVAGFKRLLAHHAGYFTIEGVSCGFEVTYMEMHITSRPPHIMIRHAIKDTALNNPLRVHSSTPHFVHRTWPIAYLKRSALLSSTSWRKDAMNNVIQRLHAYHADAYTLAIVQKFVADYFRPSRTMPKFFKHTCQNSNPNSNPQSCWLVLPWHPCLARPLGIVAARFKCPDLSQHLAVAFSDTGSSFDLRVSWSCNDSTLYQILKGMRCPGGRRG